MSDGARLRGRSVTVAGAGLAGLAAATALHRDGARATILEVRDRVGGHVRALRNSFFGGQHAEAGGDLIEADQRALQELVAQAGLSLAAVLWGGFGFVRGSPGRRRPAVVASLPAL